MKSRLIVVISLAVLITFGCSRGLVKTRVNLNEPDIKTGVHSGTITREGVKIGIKRSYYRNILVFYLYEPEYRILDTEISREELRGQFESLIGVTGVWVYRDRIELTLGPTSDWQKIEEEGINTTLKILNKSTKTG